jgi:hypothetical protein
VGANGDLRDAAITADLKPVEGLAPAFQVDWKTPDYVKAREHFGVLEPPRELRVRTRIDTDQRRAEEAALFAYRMLTARARNLQGGMDEYEWLAEIDFQAVDCAKRAQVKRQLATLLSRCGLPGVGKLKTRCVVNRVDVEPRIAEAKDKGAHSDSWVVTLQTPALMCDIAQVGAGMNDATKVYEEYWSKESDGCLELTHFHASQSLAGGEYLWRQFARRLAYRPYVLTQAGSTFVLKRVGDDPEDCLERWQRRGLPLAKPVCEAFKLKGDESDWQRCPYVPENGFGEVAVDQAWHWEMAL